MFVRLAIACAVICGVIGWDAVEIAAAQSSGPRTLMRGTTGQKRSLKLTLGHGRVDLIRFVAKLRCGDGSILIDYESGFQPIPLRGQRFREQQTGPTDDVWVRGSVQGERIVGSIRVRDRLGKVRCDSRWFSFTASRKR